MDLCRFLDGIDGRHQGTAALLTPATLQEVPGSWVTITGQNLGTATRTWRGSEFNGPILPSEVDHVLATINGKKAFVYYVSPSGPVIAIGSN